MAWFYLAITICAEVIGTMALKFSEGFTKPLPSLVVILGYGVSFYFLSKIVQVLPVSIAYAIWSGAGIALIGIIGWVWLGQKLDAGAIIGITLILAGVVVINVFSKSVAH